MANATKEEELGRVLEEVLSAKKNAT